MLKEPVLGIIELENRPLTFLGSLGNPRSYPFPVIYETAKGAEVNRIVSGDSGLADAYVDASSRLIARGARAVMATCGFAVMYQRAVAASSETPVLLSPMSLLPLLLQMTPPDRRVAVLTYDGRKLNESFLRAAGVNESSSRVCVVGIEGSDSWHKLSMPSPELELDELRRDVLALLDRVAEIGEPLGGILIECSAFCPFRDELRERSGVPVFDYLLCADLIMMCATGSAALGIVRRDDLQPPVVERWRVAQE